MILALAEVVGNTEGALTVRCQQKTSCGSCASKSHCGTGIVSDAMPTKVLDISVPSATPLDLGTLVEIGLEEKMLLKSALLVYILPLFFVFIGAFIGQFLAEIMAMGEGVVIVSSLLLGAIGMGVARSFSRKLEQDKRTVPVLLRVFGHSIIDMERINPTTEDSD